MAREGIATPAERLVWILGAVVLMVAAIALRNAVAWYGGPVPGVLVDVGGSVSSLGPSGWQGKREGLQFPQLILPADAPQLHGSKARTDAWDSAVARAVPQGFIDARVEDGERTRVVRLRVHHLESLAWWVYAGCSLIAALLYAGCGLLALWASPRGRLARTFAIFGVNTGLFLFSVFDIHTQRTLAPVFFFSFSLLPVTLVMLPLRLPNDTAWLEKRQWLEPSAYALAVIIGAYGIMTYAFGGDTRPIQSTLTLLFGSALVFFMVAYSVRYLRSRGEQRETLRILLLSMVLPYGVFVFGGFLTNWSAFAPFRGIVVDVLAYPATLFAPLGTLYAFVRHDLWGSRALLSRIATQAVLAMLACVAAIAAGTALAGGIGLHFRDAMTGAAVSTLLAMILIGVARRVSDSTLFRSRAEYKPTIEQLSADLLTITSPREVAGAIERTVRRWLPCDLVHLRLRTEADEKIPATESGSSVEQAEHHLEVEFGGQRLADLHVGRKRGGALFTRDDFDLLRTIANQGGLAIAHAQAYQELEVRRQQQAQAWRGEREALVETVAAEIAHEIRYPINYFRSVFERGAEGAKLEADDIDIGREEVDRLERLVAGLKRMAGHRLERAPVAVLELCARAEALLRDTLGERRLVLEVDPRAVVRCDLDQALQILVNLLSNGLEASSSSGSVGVSWQATNAGADLVVWDDGPGFSGDPARLFAPWFTTKERGTGLGLAITHRLVRAHGWSITAQRREQRTAFVVTVRKEDIVLYSGVLETHSEAGAEVA